MGRLVVKMRGPVAGVGRTTTGAVAALGLIGLVLGVASCGDDDPVRNDGLQRYRSLDDMVDDLDDHGVECRDLEQDADPRHALEQGRCTYEGQEVTLALHASVDERDAQAEAFTTFSQSRILVGGNWLVNLPDGASEARDLRDALGGRIFGSARPE